MSARPVRFVLATLSLILVGVICAPVAEAGRYTVIACDRQHREHPDAVFERSNAGDYTFSRSCNRPSEGSALQIKNITGAPRGHSGSIRFAAPTGARIVAAALEANLRNDEGHKARVSLLDGSGREAGRIATGTDAPATFQVFRREEPAGRSALAATLVCEREPRCPHSTQARTWIRALRLTLEDGSAPRITPGGELLAGGWLRGPRSLALQLADAGSGLARVDVRVGGKQLAPTRDFPCASIGTGSLVKSMQPCAPERSLQVMHATGREPFVNGPNRLRICARDYGVGANRHCLEREVLIDNLVPEGTLRRPERRDPELLSARLGDAHSGLAEAEILFRPAGGGEWQQLPTTLGPEGRSVARVDSSAHPAGRYRIAVRATDRAGNETLITETAEGSDLVLSFPLRERTALSWRLAPSGSPVRYGTRLLVRGRLEGRRGGVRGERVEVIERMEPGAVVPVRVRRTRTDKRGRFRLRLQRGPSRRIAVRYAGSRRYQPTAAASRRVGVLGSSRLTAGRRRVRAGESVSFRGSVGSRGARIPMGGKIVELQVRERGRGRFRTVRQALHTDGAGRLRTSYSFDRGYQRAVTFEFRLRVTPQAGWPYRAPAHSRPRPVSVLPRSG